MMKKQVILRQDLISGKMLPINELIRIVKTKDGQVLIDQSKKINGRGVYLAPDLAGLALIKKKKLLQRGLKTEINESIFEAIKAEIELNWD